MKSIALAVVLFCGVAPLRASDSPQVSEEGKACLECHTSSPPGIVEQWQSSTHAKKARTVFPATRRARMILPHSTITGTESP
jgi:hypothetical protein